MRILVALAAVTTAVLVTSPVATPTVSSKVERRAALETAVVHEMNRVRVARGLRPLRAAPALRSAARGHSQAMLTHGFFSHESADGTAFNERIRRYYTDRGFTRWSVGEALMTGQGRAVDAQAIVAAWLRVADPPHDCVVARRGATQGSACSTTRRHRQRSEALRRSSSPPTSGSARAEEPEVAPA